MESLYNLKSGKSPGPDGWPTQLIKQITEHICVPLSILFNKSLDSSTFPEKLPIILSSNSFYFNPLYISKIILSTKHPTISLIYIAMLKITIYLKKSKKDLWFSQLAKGSFSELR